MCWALVPVLPLTNCLTLDQSLVCFPFCEIGSTGLGNLQEFFQACQPVIPQHNGGDDDGGGVAGDDGDYGDGDDSGDADRGDSGHGDNGEDGGDC